MDKIFLKEDQSEIRLMFEGQRPLSMSRKGQEYTEHDVQGVAKKWLPGLWVKDDGIEK